MYKVLLTKNIIHCLSLVLKVASIRKLENCFFVHDKLVTFIGGKKHLTKWTKAPTYLDPFRHEAADDGSGRAHRDHLERIIRFDSGFVDMQIGLLTGLISPEIQRLIFCTIATVVVQYCFNGPFQVSFSLLTANKYSL